MGLSGLRRAVRGSVYIKILKMPFVYVHPHSHEEDLTVAQHRNDVDDHILNHPTTSPFSRNWFFAED